MPNKMAALLLLFADEIGTTPDEAVMNQVTM